MLCQYLYTNSILFQGLQNRFHNSILSILCGNPEKHLTKVLAQTVDVNTTGQILSCLLLTNDDYLSQFGTRKMYKVRTIDLFGNATQNVFCRGRVANSMRVMANWSIYTLYTSGMSGFAFRSMVKSDRVPIKRNRPWNRKILNRHRLDSLATHWIGTWSCPIYALAREPGLSRLSWIAFVLVNILFLTTAPIHHM